MVLRTWERTRSNSREMHSVALPTKNLIPVYAPNTPVMPKRTDPRYGTLVCPPFVPGYGTSLPVYPYRKTDSTAFGTQGSPSTPGSRQTVDANTVKTSSANLVENTQRYSPSQISPKRNGFSINELLHDNDNLKRKTHRDEREENRNNMGVSPSTLCCQGNTHEDKKLLEKCKTLDRLGKSEFPRRTMPEVMDRIRDNNSYFQRFLPTTNYHHPSLLPTGSLALQFSLQSQPSLFHPSSLYHPFHPPRSNSPPPLGVPIPVPVYLRGRAGASPSEAARAAKKCRRSRTVFTELQLMGLEKRFEKQKYLSTPDRLELAETLGLSQLQVKTWYQNRRMKWKKQVLQGGGQEAPTKPKGRPKKSDIASMEQTPSEIEQSDDSDIESVTSPMSRDSSPQRSPMVIDKAPSPTPLMPIS